MDAIHDCIPLPFDPDCWEEAVFAERFLHPLLHRPEAALFRAFGRILFYRFLEYSSVVDHGESRIASDLRGAMRDLQLLARFIQALGESFDAMDLQPDDAPRVELAERLYPQIDDLARQLAAVLPAEEER
jgi:hypothetical protein